MSTTLSEMPKLPKTLHKDKLAEIANYVLEGLSEDEACILAGFPPKQFKEIKAEHEVVGLYIEKKKIEFKRTHLNRINAKQNDKNSMWLLESLRPDEFGSKKKGGNTTVNVIGAIIKDVQQNNVLPVKPQETTGTVLEGRAKVLDVNSILK